jgi:hypothetical protein
MVELLGHDERAAIELLLERVTDGGRVYGRLVVADDPRDFVDEALCEAIDGMFYQAVAMYRLRGSARLKPEPWPPACTCDPCKRARGEADPGPEFELAQGTPTKLYEQGDAIRFVAADAGTAGQGFGGGELYESTETPWNPVPLSVPKEGEK